MRTAGEKKKSMAGKSGFKKKKKIILKRQYVTDLLFSLISI